MGNGPSALALMAQGAPVALIARRQDRLGGLSAQIQAAGGTALVVPADISDRPRLKRPFRRFSTGSDVSTSSSTTPA
jgi:NADP-dependent 3-hydroxy acid dehydrogenase YdfG